MKIVNNLVTKCIMADLEIGDVFTAEKWSNPGRSETKSNLVFMRIWDSKAAAKIRWTTLNGSAEHKGQTYSIDRTAKCSEEPATIYDDPTLSLGASR